MGQVVVQAEPQAAVAEEADAMVRMMRMVMGDDE